MVMSLLYTLWGWIKANLRLKKCLVMEADKGQITFQYKGKTYLRDKFVLLTAQSIADLKKGQIEQLINSQDRLQNIFILRSRSNGKIDIPIG